MATIEEAIARLVFEFESKGADKVGSDLDKINKFQDDISVSSQKTEQASISLEKSFDNLERRFVTTVRAQQDYANVQSKVNAAVQQNPALMERGNVVLDAAKEKFDAVSHKATEASGAFGLLAKAFGLNVSEGSKAAEIATLLEARQLKLASSVGLVGEVLSILGPVGLTAVAGLGSVLVVMDQMSQSAERMGQVAKEISSFASVTGLAANDVQSLRSEGTKFGLSFEETGSFVEKFTYQLEAAHSASGPLYDAIQKINPALAVQLALAKPGADSLNILAQAYKQAGDQAQKLALVRAAGGRNAGAEAGEFLSGIADKGGVAAVTGEVNKLDLLTKEQIEHWKTLAAQIEESSTTWKNNIASIFTGSVLESQKKFQDNLVDISRILKSFSQSDAFAGIVSGAKNLANVLTLPAQVGSSVPGKILQLARPTPSDQLPQSQDFATRFGDSTGAIQGAAPGFNSRFNDNTVQIKAANDASLQLTQTTNALTAAQEKYAQAQQAVALVQSTGVASEEAVTSARKSAGDALAVLAAVEQQHIQSLNGAGTGEEILKQKTDALTASFMLGKISAEDYNRALHGDTANQVAALQDQRNVIEATTGQMKIAAQYAADFNAQIRAGKSELDAMAIASEKVANSQASANKSVMDQVRSLKDQTDMIKAQQNGTEATTAAAIAYKDAIAKGADSSAAAAASSATLSNYAAKAAASTQQMADSAQAAADAFETAARAAHDAQFTDPGGSFGNFTPKTGQQYTSTSNLGLFQLTVEQWDKSASELASALLSHGGSVDDAIKLAQTTQPSTVLQQYGLPSKVTDADTVKAVSDLYNLKVGQTSDANQKVGFLNQEFAWLQSHGGGQDTLNALSDVTSAIKDLTGSTNTLNSTNQELLSPYYTQDPRTSHIGFRSQGMASGGEVTAPGGYSANDNMIAQIPVASGEIISVRRPGQNLSGGSTQTISVVNHITIAGNATKDEVGRTMYQVGQSMARQLQAASR